MTYVDLRPRWLFIIGFALVIVAVVFGLLGAVGDMTLLLNRVKADYLTRYGEPLNVARYLYKCAGDQSCLETYYRAWKAPAWAQALYLSCLVSGVVFAAFARVWKPEVLYRRQVRVAAGLMEENRKKSATKPKGTLVVKEVQG